MDRCPDCGYAVRGRAHKEGDHHKRQRPTRSKQERRLDGRIRAFEAEKVRLEKTSSAGWHNQINRPGSLQAGRCRS